MNWLRYYNVLKGIAALSGLVAFISLSITLYKDYRVNEKNLQIQQDQERIAWSEAAVYDLLFKSGIAGLSFSELLSKYQAVGISTPNEIPRENLREVALQRVLVSLVARSAVVFRNDQTYALAMVPRAILSADIMAGRDLELRNKIIDLVDGNPSKYSMLELVEESVQRFSASRGEAIFTISNLGKSLLLKSDIAGKVSVDFLTLPPPFLPPPAGPQ